MTTLYIRHPAKASVDGAPPGSAALCQFALAGDAGNLLQQGAAPLASLSDVVGAARRVVLLLSAADVTLLRVKLPPLSAARLKLALPNLVEEQILGDPAGCVLVAGPSLGVDGLRSVAVAQRNWLEALVRTLLAQGARNIAAVPAQLCLPIQAGTVSAALASDPSGLELTLRLGEFEGLGLCLPSQPLAALQTLRAFAAEAPVTLYVPAAEQALYEPLLAEIPGISLATDHWAHWIASARAGAEQQLDLVPALGASGTQARNWRQWRWPLRFAVLALLVNVVGINVEWLRLKRDTAAVRLQMAQTFKAVYPNEAAIYPVEQMRRNIAAAQVDSGQVAADEFTALCAAFGEAMSGGVAKAAIASIEYRDRALLVKPKPNMLDAAAQQRIKTALAARNLQMSEPTPGTWQIRSGVAATTSGAKS